MKAWRKKKLEVTYHVDEDGNPLKLFGREAKKFMAFFPTVKAQLPKITLALLNRAGVFNDSIRSKASS